MKVRREISNSLASREISNSTALKTRGGGVGIWVPNTFKHKIRNDLKSFNRSFFESLWLEIQAPLKKNLLVNVSYCSNKNLSEFFLEDNFLTDNVELFGDYDISFFNQRERGLLKEFASKNGLEIVNKNTPNWTNGNQKTLIDHCLTTKHQIFDTTVIEQLFGSDHFTQISFCLWTLIMKTTKRSFLSGY